MSGADDGFQQVTRKQWLARKCIGRRKHQKSESDYLADCPEVNVDSFHLRLERLSSEMAQSDYFIQSMNALQLELNLMKRPLERIICLGLGPFTRTHQALHQVAFIISAQRHHNIKEALYFDPVFRDSEKVLLQRLGCTVLSEDCVGKYEAPLPTLYYLPHCPYALMHNVLWSNWSINNLSNVLLISNSFDSLVTNRIKSKQSPDDLIARITPKCTEITLEDDYEQQNVFNDLSLHSFPHQKLPEQTDTLFWTRGISLKLNEDEMPKELKLTNIERE
ncbi:CG7988, partial [Drosophila busckii]